MASSADALIKQIKEFFAEEHLRKASPTRQFSDDAVELACQKLSAGLKDAVESEEDPMVISEMLKNYLAVEEMVSERGLGRQQMLIKLFEQLNKYEQSRYY